MTEFKRETHTVNGVKIVLLTAGSGEPLMFLHGAGTFHGFEFAKPWADKFRVILPFHPGFGESGDGPAMNDIHDYVMHYVELLDLLGLDKVNLVGFSLGGYIAAKFAMEHGHRVRKLVLVGPAGLRDDKHPTADVLGLPGEQLPAMLVSNFEVIKPYLPTKPDLDSIGDRYREMTTTARLLWERPFDTKLPRYLHRLTMPDASGLGRGRSAHPLATGGDLAALHSQGRYQDLQGRRPPRARREARGERRRAELSRVTDSTPACCRTG
jgi:pimeloyl-ACP methyl ester carboxylesterase